MITRLVLENFQCFRAIDVPLRPLSVLIGLHDSGKSSFLRAIQSQGRKREGFRLGDHYRRQKASAIHLTAVLNNGPAVERRSDASEDSSRVMQTALDPIEYFQLPSDGIATECEGFTTKQNLELGNGGERVAALLDHYLRTDRSRFDMIVGALRGSIPGLEDIKIATPDAQSRRIDVVIDNGLEIEARRTSAGVRLMMFFVALAYHTNPPRTILLEEPENGIHPRRLAEVIQLLREITEGKHGAHAAQVILTTHSPYLLDQIDIEKDQVLVFRRDVNGDRNAKPANAERLKTFLDEFMLGEVWYNEQEEGLVAKP